MLGLIFNARFNSKLASFCLLKLIFYILLLYFSINFCKLQLIHLESKYLTENCFCFCFCFCLFLFCFNETVGNQVRVCKSRTELPKSVFPFFRFFFELLQPLDSGNRHGVESGVPRSDESTSVLKLKYNLFLIKFQFLLQNLKLMQQNL